MVVCFFHTVLILSSTGQWWYLDATRACGTIGRLINHDKNLNLKVVEGMLRLGFLAKLDITTRVELLLDYGMPLPL